MRNLLLCASLFLIGSASCKHSDVEPAQSIEGTYQAKFYDQSTNPGNAIPYPINGQELTLQIKYVSTDTVSVQITPSSMANALPNGVYFPTQTLFYPKAYIESPTNTATYIYLTGKPGSPISTTNTQIWIYKDKQSADYFFTPQQTPSIARSIRFEKNTV